MRTTAFRLVAAGVATSVTLGWLSPLVQAQPVTPTAESVPLENAEQPMLPTAPTSPDPAVAQAQPAPPLGQQPAAPTQPGPVMPAPPMQPTPPPAPAPVVAPPAPPVAQPAQPDLFQETLKAEASAADRKQAMYNAGAAVTNIFLIPGRAITCTLGAGVGVVLLALTFGTGYKAAGAALDEGCGGKWVVSGDDLRPEGSRAFDWER
ncbi:MAG TPA: hypothetical protein VFQ62_09585 [Methylomirabilota bacterium]|nr:hypothetical protein [Methylomirabilota bacterium]